jgi:hypothetical protein
MVQDQGTDLSCPSLGYCKSELGLGVHVQFTDGVDLGVCDRMVLEVNHKEEYVL